MTDTGLAAFLADHKIQWESDATVPAEVIVETAGRICYLSFENPRPGGNATYIDHIKKVGHGSVLEHAVWTIIVTGISRSCSHELVRHRVGVAFSQLSQRYVDESVNEVVCPPDLRIEVQAAETMLANRHADWTGDDVVAAIGDLRAAKIPTTEQPLARLVMTGLQWILAASVASGTYRILVTHQVDKPSPPGATKTDARKFARQSARSILPNATETKIVITANARSWRHMIEMRASAHADPEIRVLFTKILDVLAVESPALFSDYTQVPLPDGTREVHTPYRKV